VRRFVESTVRLVLRERPSQDEGREEGKRKSALLKIKSARGRRPNTIWFYRVERVRGSPRYGGRPAIPIRTAAMTKGGEEGGLPQQEMYVDRCPMTCAILWPFVDQGWENDKKIQQRENKNLVDRKKWSTHVLDWTVSRKGGKK